MLQSFFTSVSSVLVILVLTATGYFLGAAGWIKKEHKDCLSKILIDVFVPLQLSVRNADASGSGHAAGIGDLPSDPPGRHAG